MGWIDINKKFPTYYEPVLIVLENKHQLVCWRASDGENEIYTILDTDNIITDKITHWKPLSKAPK